ncbi:MAG TPA: DUF1254 domain-containing protein [Gemmatimonadaceae bacterium]|nr:DUF1254 domain-containing protein [Gemmatimonadaceae bacterium]
MTDAPNRPRTRAQKDVPLQPDYVVPNRGGDARVGGGAATARVTVENFRRAESDRYMKAIVDAGGFATFYHHRLPMPIDKQEIVRSNRDTLYSAAVFDLDAGAVTISLPNAMRRFMSLQVIDQDHYSHATIYGAGSHTFAKDLIGTRYMLAAVRTLANPFDEKDLAEAHALQTNIGVLQHATGAYEVPSWDPAGLARVRGALTVLGETITDSKRTFGMRGQVDPVRHLIATATAWGGNPEKDATYLTVTPARNDGETVYRLNVDLVPVDGFWSISVYNSQGYFEPNERNAYSINNLTAKRNDDNTVDVQFGGCDADSPNCLPINPGWNYTVRLYRPRAEILSGQWKFPQARPAP